MDKTVGWLTLTQTVNLAGALVIGVVLARVLGPSGQGLVQVTVLVPATLTLILSVGGGATLTYLASRTDDLAGLLGWLLALAAAGALLSAAVLQTVPGMFRAARLAGISPELLGAGALAVAGQIAANGISAIALARHRLRTVFTVSVLPRLVVLGGIGAGALGGGLRPSAVIGLYWIGSVGAGILGMVALKPAGRVRWHPAIVRQALGYGMRGHLGNIAQFLNYRISLFLVGLWGHTGQAGLYWLALTLAEFLWYMPQAVAGSWLPRAAAGSIAARDTVVTARVLGWTGVILGAAGGLLARILIPVIWGSRFSPAVPILWGLLPGAMIFTWSKVLAADLAGRGSPQWGTAASLTGLGILVGAGRVGLGQGALEGLALAQSLSYLVTTALLVEGFRRRHPEIRWQEIFRIRPSEWWGFWQLRRLAVKDREI